MASPQKGEKTTSRTPHSADGTARRKYAQQPRVTRIGMLRSAAAYIFGGTLSITPTVSLAYLPKAQDPHCLTDVTRFLTRGGAR